MGASLSSTENAANAFLQDKGYQVAFLEKAHGTLEIALEDADGKGPAAGTCARLHVLLRTYLEQQGLLSENTSLEVGSPGLDRPLKKPTDYQRFQGAQVQLALHEARDGKKTLTGTLQEAGERGIVLHIHPLEHTKKRPGKGSAVAKKEATQCWDLAYTEIRHCKLVPIL